MFLQLLPLLLLPWQATSGPSGSGFTDTDNNIALSLGQFFETSFTIYLRHVDDPLPGVYVNDTYPAKNNVFTTVMTFQELEMHKTKKLVGAQYGGTTLVVMKYRKELLENLKEFSQQHKISSFNWVLFLEPNTHFSQDLLEGVYIPFDCEFVCVTQRDVLHVIVEVYQIAKHQKFQTQHFGYWSSEKELSGPTLSFYSRRNNFKGHTFKAAISNNPPYTYVQQQPNGNPSFGGYFYEVWKELEFRLSFNTEFPEVQINQDPNKVLTEPGIDFLVAPITLGTKVVRFFTLSEPIYVARIYLFGHRPGSELEWNSYLKPFSSTTWYVNLAWMFCSAAALAVLYKVAWQWRTSEVEADYYIFTFSECIATVFRAMCMQGSDVTPKSSACRLLFLSIYMTALVVTSAFSAALFSLLTIPVSRAPFNTFDEVLNTRGYKMGIIPDSDIHSGLLYLAERFPNSAHDRMNKMMGTDKNKLPSSVLEGLNRICEDKMYILMWDLPNVLEAMQNMSRDCQNTVMPAGPMVFREHIGFGFRSASPYKEIIDLHLIRMRNEGIMRRLLVNYWPPRIPSVPTTWVRVTLADISPILYMFSFGAVLSVAILFLERAKSLVGNRGPPPQDKSFWQEVSNYMPQPKSSQLSKQKSEWENEYTNWDKNGNYFSNNYTWNK